MIQLVNYRFFNKIVEKKQKDRDILNKNYNEIENEIQSEFYSNNKQKVNKLDNCTLKIVVEGSYSIE